jgi:hypothetical protein
VECEQLLVRPDETIVYPPVRRDDECPVETAIQIATFQTWNVASHVARFALDDVSLDRGAARVSKYYWYRPPYDLLPPCRDPGTYLVGRYLPFRWEPARAPGGGWKRHLAFNVAISLRLAGFHQGLVAEGVDSDHL